MTPDQVLKSPDASGRLLTAEPIGALRYDHYSDDPHEVAGIIKELLPSNSRILDVGCGTGAVNVVANMGKSNLVYGIEPDADRAEVARSRGIDVHVGILDQNYIDRNGLFDVIICSDVLEHMVDPSAALKLFLEALKPGGIMIASVPNVAHWGVRVNLLFGRFNYAPVGIMDATHLRWFTERSIIELIKESHFSIKSVRQTAGVNLPVYNKGTLRRIPETIRKPSVRMLAKSLPRLFGAQHVVVGQKRSDRGVHSS